MRLGRRGLLWGLGLAGLCGLGAAGTFRALSGPHGSDSVRTVEIEAQPLGPLLPAEPARRTFGELVFRSGLVLTARDFGFGGFSSLWRSPDGASLVALSDNAQWLNARAVLRDGRLAGLEGGIMAPVLGADGVPLRHGLAFDTESLAISDGVAFVGIERVQEVRRFDDWADSGVGARGVTIPLPDEIGRLPANRGLEALALAPPGHPLAGALLGIAEGNDDESSPTRGWVLTGPDRFAFDVARSNAFNVTDMQFLPTGELMLLERHFSLARGVACRMRRVAADAIRPDVTLDGRVVFGADRRHAIDNMEGLALHTDPGSGATIVTLVSDDNFSPLQRTLVLEFELAG